MNKPWEQTWRVGRRVARHIYRNDGAYGVVGTLDFEADAKLAATAPEMARLLLQLEYAGGGTDCDSGTTHSQECALCGTYEGRPHTADCALDALLRKAGVR